MCRRTLTLLSDIFLFIDVTQTPQSKIIWPHVFLSHTTKFSSFYFYPSQSTHWQCVVFQVLFTVKCQDVIILLISAAHFTKYMAAFLFFKKVFNISQSKQQ